MAVIVVAEDDTDVGAIFERVLKRAGFTVHLATDGQAALDLTVAQHPDAVLSDLDMPVMTGLQLCRAIRLDPRVSDIPVVLISGSLQPGDPRAAEAQACDVALKPFKNAELVLALQRLCDMGAHRHDGADLRCPIAAVDR